MRDFNLQRQEDKFIKQLDNIDLSNKNEILNWIEESLKYNRIFYSRSLIEFVITKLKSSLYEEFYSPVEEARLLDDLITGKNDINYDKVADMLISMYIKTLRNSETPSSFYKLGVSMYNEKCNKNLKINSMINNLKNNIGTVVIVDYVHEQMVKQVKGKILTIDGVKTITLENDKYPFIGYNTAILNIQTIDGEVLYHNDIINNTYALEDFDNIENLNKEVFGELYDESLKKVY